MFDKITFERSILELIAQGYLVDLRGIHVKTATNLDRVGTLLATLAPRIWPKRSTPPPVT